jgi:hypothetical protein
MASGRSDAVVAGDGVFGPARLSTTASVLMVGGGLGHERCRPVDHRRQSGPKDDLHRAVMLFLEDVVGARCVGQRQGVGGEAVDA